MQRSRTKLFGLVLIASIAAFASIACIAFCEATVHVRYEALPPPHPPPGTPRNTLWQTISIRASDGATLEAWFVRHPRHPSRGCVIALHGIADSRQGAAGFAPMFLDAGYSVLLPDSRAHGRSGGQVVTYGLLEKYDVLDWVQRLRHEGRTAIYGLGESLGASILIQASALQPAAFRAIVAECPYSDLRTVAEERVRQFVALPAPLSAPLAKLVVSGGMIYARLHYGLDFSQVSPILSISRTATPILLIHGLEDTKTPYRHSVRLAAASPSASLWLVPEVGHTSASAADPQAFHTRVLEWYARHSHAPLETSSQTLK